MVETVLSDSRVAERALDRDGLVGALSRLCGWPVQLTLAAPGISTIKHTGVLRQLREQHNNARFAVDDPRKDHGELLILLHPFATGLCRPDQPIRWTQGDSSFSVRALDRAAPDAVEVDRG